MGELEIEGGGGEGNGVEGMDIFFLHKHMRMHSRTRLCRGVTVE